jgi:hypothetical protein
MAGGRAGGRAGRWAAETTPDGGAAAFKVVGD